MSTPSDHVTFTSGAFPVEPGEDQETNPGIYGRTLATWVAQKLRDRGIPVVEVLAEDFGRIVIVRRKPYLLWIGCASIDNSQREWQMFLALELGLFGRLLHRKEGQEELDRLRGHFRAIVAEIPGVSAIEWQ
ncbi:MAG: hypothetical protein C5B56_02425 [Proteobacteria bacterium]|nr:MAG: hypothetical protein C5B56_02425 [Pseudomonadota bacterium]